MLAGYEMHLRDINTYSAAGRACLGLSVNSRAAFWAGAVMSHDD
jgi:hypothetical protein